MKKLVISGCVMILLASCGGASEEQTKAAKEMCECMDAAVMGDFDIDYYECELQIHENYSGEIFSDEGWAAALEAECPAVADQLTDNE